MRIRAFADYWRALVLLWCLVAFSNAGALTVKEYLDFQFLSGLSDDNKVTVLNSLQYPQDGIIPGIVDSHIGHLDMHVADKMMSEIYQKATKALIL